MSFKSLAPGFLIASPPLGDPNFDRTVVMLAVHNEGGALGFVVNRQAPIMLGELLEHAGYDDVVSEAPVWMGGPVQPQSGWIIVDDPELSGEGVIEVTPNVRVSSSREAFDRLAERQRQVQVEIGLRAASAAPPHDGRCLVLLGYSGWGAAQLEGEIARGAWLPTPLDEGILFDVESDERWVKAYALLGLTPTHLMTMRSVGEA